MAWAIAFIVMSIVAGLSFVAVYWLKLQETKTRKAADFSVIEAEVLKIKNIELRLQHLEMQKLANGNFR